MADHDQRFKGLLREMPGEFLSAFFPEEAARLDLSSVEWLEQEQFLDPPAGERRVVDLVAKVRTVEPLPDTADPGLALLHLEIESGDAAAGLRRRAFQYHHQLRNRHGLGVLTLALLTGVGLGGVGRDVYEERLWGRTTTRFEYGYVGLPALSADDYAQGNNPLAAALASRMRPGPAGRARLKADVLRRIAELTVAKSLRQFLLTECVEAYLVLEGAEQAQFEALTRTEEYAVVEQLKHPWIAEGEERGEARGIAVGEARANVSRTRDLLLFLGTTRFGEPDPTTRVTLDRTEDFDTLDRMFRRAATAGSWAEVLAEVTPRE